VLEEAAVQSDADEAIAAKERNRRVVGLLGCFELTSLVESMLSWLAVELDVDGEREEMLGLAPRRRDLPS